MKTIVLTFFAFLLLGQPTWSGQCSVNLDRREDGDGFVDHYQTENAQFMVLFSSHSTRTEDNELKTLWRQLSKEVSERRKRLLRLQVEAKISQNSERLQFEKDLVEKVRIEQRQEPFIGVLGEFSHQKADRYKLRIEVANFVRGELIETVGIDKQQADDFILLLVGEDIFPLLKGEFLSHLPLIPSEDQDIMNKTSSSLGQCVGMMGLLNFSEEPLAVELYKKMSVHYRPHPQNYENFLAVKEETFQVLTDNPLLRLRAGILKEEDLRHAVDRCDVLYDLSRDQVLAERMMLLEGGRYLITRGTAHRWLLHQSYCQ